MVPHQHDQHLNYSVISTPVFRRKRCFCIVFCYTSVIEHVFAFRKNHDNTDSKVLVFMFKLIFRGQMRDPISDSVKESLESTIGASIAAMRKRYVSVGCDSSTSSFA